MAQKVVIFVTLRAFLEIVSDLFYHSRRARMCKSSQNLDIIEPCTIQLVVNPSTVAQPELHRHRPRKKWKWHAVKPFLV